MLVIHVAYSNSFFGHVVYNHKSLNGNSNCMRFSYNNVVRIFLSYYCQKASGCVDDISRILQAILYVKL